jgi:hypothetical protein
MRGRLSFRQIGENFGLDFVQTLSPHISGQDHPVLWIRQEFRDGALRPAQIQSQLRDSEQQMLKIECLRVKDSEEESSVRRR